MKKILSVILSSAIAASSAAAIMPLGADAAGSQYEFENGVIGGSGENPAAVSTVTGASGGQAVDLQDGGNTVTLKVNAAEAGAHRLTIRFSQPYDEDGKYQNVIVNGKNAGEIFCEYTGEGKFSTVSVNADLMKGENEITVEASWGWTFMDALLVEKGSFSNYSGGGTLSNPKASAQAQSL